MTISKRENRTTVLLVDDQPAVLDAVREWISHEPGLEIVGQATDGASALAQVAQLQPDVVLIDVAMPGLDGISTARAIHSTAPETKVVILTIYDNPATREAARAAGAAAFVAKHEAIETLPAVIAAVIADTE